MAAEVVVSMCARFFGISFSVFVLVIGCDHSPVDLAAGPRIDVLNQEIDLGVIEYGQSPKEAMARIRNMGDEKLLINRIDTSCACTKATLDKVIIPPGDTAILTISLSKDLPSKLAARINLFCNDPLAPSHTISIKWSRPAIPELRLVDAAYPVLYPGTKVRVAAQLIGQKEMIRDVSIEENLVFDAVSSGEVRLVSVNGGELQIEIESGREPGKHFAVARLPSGEVNPELTCKFGWIVKDEFELQPSRLLGFVGEGEKSYRFTNVLLNVNGSREVSSLEDFSIIASEGIVVSNERRDIHSISFDIEVPVPSGSEINNGEVTVKLHFNDGHNWEGKLPYSVVRRDSKEN